MYKFYEIGLGISDLGLILIEFRIRKVINHVISYFMLVLHACNVFLIYV